MTLPVSQTTKSVSKSMGTVRVIKGSVSKAPGNQTPAFKCSLGPFIVEKCTQNAQKIA